jgi:murein DD-endopeptidase MepM/ murein hydrolase activator NlpD
MFLIRRREELNLSPRGIWVRITHWLRVGVECVVAVGLAAAVAWPLSTPDESTTASALPPAPPPPLYNLEPARLATASETAALAAVFGPVRDERVYMTAPVRRGDTLRNVLERAGVAPADFHPAIVALGDVFDARTLRSGQKIDLYLRLPEEEGKDPLLMALTFAPDVAQTIEVTRRSDGAFHARKFDAPLTRRVARAQGAITESLYADAIEAGADALVIGEIARLLAYAVDFQREIHPGDPFEIVFEQFLNPAGQVVKTGEIYYIGFAPRGRELAYWRFNPPGDDEDTGYYDAKGESARRFLMKTPVNATRISSGFSSARRHPVLGYTRAHKGTDFAAPRGTPIYAAGNGVVERANRYGSFGNYVRIRHANGYKTIYGHLNGFARGVRAGVRVRQGQTIGYVGMTGTATGPHLHYEVHVNGTAVNPMRVDLPTGRTLTEEEKPAFETVRLEIDAMRAVAVAADAPMGATVASGEAVDQAALESTPDL